MEEVPPPDPFLRQKVPPTDLRVCGINKQGWLLDLETFPLSLDGLHSMRYSLFLEKNEIIRIFETIENVLNICTIPLMLYLFPQSFSGPESIVWNVPCIKLSSPVIVWDVLMKLNISQWELWTFLWRRQFWASYRDRSVLRRVCHSKGPESLFGSWTTERYGEGCRGSWRTHWEVSGLGASFGMNKISHEFLPHLVAVIKVSEPPLCHRSTRNLKIYLRVHQFVEPPIPVSE